MFGLGRKRAAPKGDRPWLNVFRASETGLVRKDNQDSVLVDADAGVYCVADGMGGGAEGAQAAA